MCFTRQPRRRQPEMSGAERFVRRPCLPESMWAPAVWGPVGNQRPRQWRVSCLCLVLQAGCCDSLDSTLPQRWLSVCVPAAELGKRGRHRGTERLTLRAALSKSVFRQYFAHTGRNLFVIFIEQTTPSRVRDRQQAICRKPTRWRELWTVHWASSLTAWLKTLGSVVAAGTIMALAGELLAIRSADVSSRYRRDMRRHCRV